MSGLALAGAVILFSTIGLAIACLIAYSVIMRKRHYRCPYCGFRFKTSSIRSFFAKTNGADKLLVCPNCGKSGYMEFCHDDEANGDNALPESKNYNAAERHRDNEEENSKQE